MTGSKYDLGGGLYSTTAPRPGQRWLIHDGARIVEVELTEQYIGTLWKARVVSDHSQTRLVETRLR